MRLLDRDPAVSWLVAQPCEVSWPRPDTATRRKHIPDLLTVDREHRVTVWDVKNPDGAQSAGFVDDSLVTQLSCEKRGWSYQVFTGLEFVHRHNLLWLQPYRRRPAWTTRYEDGLLATVARGVALGQLIRDDDDAERLAVMWHLIWSGRLVVNLSERLTAETVVTA